MIKKIISEGQTGVERAAVEAAKQLNIQHGRWLPKCLIAGDKTSPEISYMKGMIAAGYFKRAEQNIIDADGTLILTYGTLTKECEHGQKIATNYNRPWLHIDLNKTVVFKAIANIYYWLISQGIGTLNVVGVQDGNDLKIYQTSKEILEASIRMIL